MLTAVRTKMEQEAPFKGRPNESYLGVNMLAKKNGAKFINESLIEFPRIIESTNQAQSYGARTLYLYAVLRSKGVVI